jgi:hypothetical protein
MAKGCQKRESRVLGNASVDGYNHKQKITGSGCAVIYRCCLFIYSTNLRFLGGSLHKTKHSENILTTA